MTRQTKGFVLIMISIFLVFGLAGGVELMEPDAGYKEWASVFVGLLMAGVLGLLGFSYMQEE